MRKNNNNSPSENKSHHLEPRVAKLEEGMERLTEDVRSLAGVVREQGSQMEQEIQKLIVAVTQAAGPRKTDWQTIFAGIMLIFAIGSAVFWPLNRTAQDNRLETKALEKRVDEHEKLPLHPVGQALMARLEERIKENNIQNEKGMDFLKQYLLEKLDDERKNEDLRLADLKSKNDKLSECILKLESHCLQDTEREKDELQSWRQKAMGLIPDPVDNYKHPRPGDSLRIVPPK